MEDKNNTIESLRTIYWKDANYPDVDLWVALNDLGDFQEKMKEAGRREVLEEFFKYIEYLEGYKLDDYEELWSSLGCRKRMIIKALTSDPQTPHSSSLARNTSEVQVAGDVGSNPTEESSSEGCGKKFIVRGEYGQKATCGVTRFCDECKQKQEKK